MPASVELELMDAAPLVTDLAMPPASRVRVVPLGGANLRHLLVISGLPVKNYYDAASRVAQYMTLTAHTPATGGSYEIFNFGPSFYACIGQRNQSGRYVYGPWVGATVNDQLTAWSFPEGPKKSTTWVAYKTLSGIGGVWIDPVVETVPSTAVLRCMPNVVPRCTQSVSTDHGVGGRRGAVGPALRLMVGAGASGL